MECEGSSGSVALLMRELMQQYTVEWMELSARLMWVTQQLKKKCRVFVSAQGPGSENTDYEVQLIGNDLTECASSFMRN